MIPKIKVLALDLQRWGAQFSPLHLILTFIFLISPNRGIDIIVLLEEPDGFPNLSRSVFRTYHHEVDGPKAGAKTVVTHARE